MPLRLQPEPGDECPCGAGPIYAKCCGRLARPQVSRPRESAMDQAIRLRRERWRDHERDVEKRTGDRRVRGSGNQPGRPGDNIGDRFRELKSTKHDSIRVQASWLLKLVTQALCMNRRPVLELRLHGASYETDYVLVPEDDCDVQVKSERQSRGAGFTVNSSYLSEVHEHGSVRVELRVSPPVPSRWVLMTAQTFDDLCGARHDS